MGFKEGIQNNLIASKLLGLNISGNVWDMDLIFLHVIITFIGLRVNHILTHPHLIKHIVFSLSKSKYPL